MKKYNVLVTADATVSTTIEVEAPNSLVAERLALGLAREHADNYKWELDDGNHIEPYLCDPGNCAEEAAS
jgi:hypothetical protein